ncbi:Fungal specific transcription factor domain-containing protein [Cladophialophora immunda]|nr:Fungal specific transcription factor domain-containing protein [Cladophialophora immunda]
MERFQDTPRKPDLSREDIDEFLRQRRDNRTPRACYPCHQRKVKCNYVKPCQTCIDRGYPEICIYDAPRAKSVLETTASSSAASTTPAASDEAVLTQKTALLEQTLWRVKEDIDRALGAWTPRAESSTAAQLSRQSPSRDATWWTAPAPGPSTRGTGQPVHLGQNPVQPSLVATARPDPAGWAQDISNQEILSIFALENQSVTYPFSALWGLHNEPASRFQSLCELLPGDVECRSLFTCYSETAHAVFPAIPDLDQFQNDLTEFLARRSNPQKTPRSETDTNPHAELGGRDLHWLGLLFACLASGCQYSTLPCEERRWKSRVYVCCAYECLRSTNYLGYPTLFDVQNMLVIADVMANSHDAGVAWCFEGLTIRLAQSLGLHLDQPLSTPDSLQRLRKEIWWRIVWQESSLALAFDRPSTLQVQRTIITPGTNELSYNDCMKTICEIGLEIVRERSTRGAGQFTLEDISRFLGALNEMTQEAAPYLKDATLCHTTKARLEYWSLYLHRSYVNAELYRSLLRDRSSSPDDLDAYVRCLSGTITGFLHLQVIAPAVKQSSIFVQRALSSALMLCTMDDLSRTRPVQYLVHNFISAMKSPCTHCAEAHLPTPFSKSITRLHEMAATRWSSDPPSFSIVRMPTGAAESHDHMN